MRRGEERCNVERERIERFLQHFETFDDYLRASERKKDEECGDRMAQKLWKWVGRMRELEEHILRKRSYVETF